MKVFELVQTKIFNQIGSLYQDQIQNYSKTNKQIQYSNKICGIFDFFFFHFSAQIDVMTHACSPSKSIK
jgi:hypothetical protein